MKYYVLAMVVSSILSSAVASAAEVYNKDGNKLDLYGRVKAQHYFSDDDGYDSDGDQSHARLGFKGESQIADQLTGFARFEYQFNANEPESTNGSSSSTRTRLAFAGLKFGDYGSFDYGRNYGIVYDALAWTDVLPEFGGDTVYTDNFMVGRTTGVATYRNNGFFGLVDGLNFAVQYQGKNERDYSDDGAAGKRDNGDGYGVSLSYESPIGVGVVGSYASSDRTDRQAAAYYASGDGRAEQWATSLKYDRNNVYIAATYAETRNATYIENGYTGLDGFANKTQDFAVVVQYNFDFGLQPTLSYFKSRAKNVEGIGDVDLVEYYEVGLTYFFNKNMSVYADYIINQIDSDNRLGVGSDNTVALGVLYNF